MGPLNCMLPASTSLRRLSAQLRRLSPSFTQQQTRKMSKVTRVEKTEAEWKAVLNPAQYQILREKGTERGGTGEYNKHSPPSGHYKCAGCSAPLYSAQSKFDSGCGWPAFDKCYDGALKVEVDNSMGMRRVEIMCAGCDGHLGHVFEGEKFTVTNERHCVNSPAIIFAPEEHKAAEAPVKAE